MFRLALKIESEFCDDIHQWAIRTVARNSRYQALADRVGTFVVESIVAANRSRKLQEATLDGQRTAPESGNLNPRGVSNLEDLEIDLLPVPGLGRDPGGSELIRRLSQETCVRCPISTASGSLGRVSGQRPCGNAVFIRVFESVGWAS